MFKVLIIDFVHKTFTKNTAKNMYSLMLIQRYVGAVWFVNSNFFSPFIICGKCYVEFVHFWLHSREVII